MHSERGKARKLTRSVTANLFDRLIFVDMQGKSNAPKSSYIRPHQCQSSY